MAPAGTLSLNSSGWRSRSRTVIRMAIGLAPSKAVIHADVWLQGGSQRLGVDGKLVKIGGFVFQSAKSATHPKAGKYRVVQPEVKGELGQQLASKMRCHGRVQIGDRPSDRRKVDDTAAQAQVGLNAINGGRLQ